MIENQDKKSGDEKFIYVGSIILLIQGILLLVDIIMSPQVKYGLFLPSLSLLAGILGLKIRENYTGFYVLVVTHLIVYGLSSVMFLGFFIKAGNIKLLYIVVFVIFVILSTFYFFLMRAASRFRDSIRYKSSYS